MDFRPNKASAESFLRDVVNRSSTPGANRSGILAGLDAVRSVERTLTMPQETTVEITAKMNQAKREIALLRQKESKTRFETLREAKLMQMTAAKVDRERTAAENLRREREFAARSRDAERKSREESLQWRRAELAHSREMKQKAREERRLEVKSRARESMTEAEWKAFLAGEQQRRKKEELAEKAAAAKAEREGRLAGRGSEITKRRDESLRSRDVTMSFELRKLRAEREELEKSFHLVEALSQRKRR
eukprot:TRINITY_DN11481_c0_g1_i2.p1 TRINITY_DN11481_c0_g1~~TRINITY_DN11481_c0_g1_i2.p1  ORF type:complete len:248 (-),score=64.04 TRINITY_DN11481_c0_g1_i2:59-802(-)